MTPGWLPKRARKETEGNTGPEDAVPVLDGGLGYEVDPVGAIFRVFTLACIAARRVALRGLPNALPEGDSVIGLNGASSLQLTPYTMLVVAHAVKRTEQELRSLSASPCSSRAISRQGSSSELEDGLDKGDAAPAGKALQVATAPTPAARLSPSSSSCSLPQTPRQQQKAPRAPTPCSPRSLASTRPASLFSEPQASSLADRSASSLLPAAQNSSLASTRPAWLYSDPHASSCADRPAPSLLSTAATPPASLYSEAQGSNLAATAPRASLASQLHTSAPAATPPASPVSESQVSTPAVRAAPASLSSQPRASPALAAGSSCGHVAQISAPAATPLTSILSAPQVSTPAVNTAPASLSTQPRASPALAAGSSCGHVAQISASAATPLTSILSAPQVSILAVNTAPASLSPQPQASPALAATAASCHHVAHISWPAAVPLASLSVKPLGAAAAARSAVSLPSTPVSTNLAATAPPSLFSVSHGSTVGTTPPLPYSSALQCSNLAVSGLPPPLFSMPHLSSSACSPPASLVTAPQASTPAEPGKCEGTGTAGSCCRSSFGSGPSSRGSNKDKPCGASSSSSSRGDGGGESSSSSRGDGGGDSSGASSESCGRSPNTAVQIGCDLAQRQLRALEEQPAVQPAGASGKSAKVLPECPTGLLPLPRAAPFKAARQRPNPTPMQSPSPPRLWLQLQEQEGQAGLVSCNKECLKAAVGLPSSGSDGMSSSCGYQLLATSAAIATLSSHSGACSDASAAAALDRVAPATEDEPALLHMAAPWLAARESEALAEGGPAAAPVTAAVALAAVSGHSSACPEAGAAAASELVAPARADELVMLHMAAPWLAARESEALAEGGPAAAPVTAAAALAAVSSHSSACPEASAVAAPELVALARADELVMLRMVAPGLAARESEALAKGGPAAATAAAAASAACAAGTGHYESSRDRSSPANASVLAPPVPVAQGLELEGGEQRNSTGSGAADSAAGSPAGEAAAEHGATLQGSNTGRGQQEEQQEQLGVDQRQPQELLKQQQQQQQQPSWQQGNLWRQGLRLLKQPLKQQQQPPQHPQQQQQQQQQESWQQGDLWRQGLRLLKQQQLPQLPKQQQAQESWQQGDLWRQGLRVLKRALVVGAAVVVLNDGGGAVGQAPVRGSTWSRRGSSGASRKDLSPYAVLAWGSACPARQQHLPYFQVVQQQQQLQRATFLSRAQGSSQGRPMVPAGAALPPRPLQ